MIPMTLAEIAAATGALRQDDAAAGVEAGQVGPGRGGRAGCGREDRWGC